MSVSHVGRRHGISGSQIFTWRRLMAQGALTAASAGEGVVPASEYRVLEAQVLKLERFGQGGETKGTASRHHVPGRRLKKMLLRSTSLLGRGL